MKGVPKGSRWGLWKREYIVKTYCMKTKTIKIKFFHVCVINLKIAYLKTETLFLGKNFVGTTYSYK